MKELMKQKYWAVIILLFISVNVFGQNLLVNPGAETGNNEGWIDSDEAWGATAEITPHEGSYFFWPSRKAIPYTQMYQDLDVTGYSSDSYFHLSGWLANWNQSPHDRATLAIAALDANGNQLFYASREHRNPTWGYYEVISQLPVGTKTLRVSLIATRFVGSDNDAYFDELSLEMTNDVPTIFVNISSEGNKKNIAIGSTLQLSANTTGGTDNNYTWSSSYDEIASVDENGIVTAQSSGSFTIQAIGNTTQAIGYISLVSHPENFIKFTNPKGSEEWESNKEIALSWDVIGTVGVSTLYWSSNDGVEWKEISEITPTTGGFLWSIPATEETLNNCVLKISWSDGESISSRFSIIPANSSSGSQTIILEEDFDDDFTESNPFPWNGWSVKRINSNVTWVNGSVSDNNFNTIDVTNKYSAVCSWVAENHDEWIISPNFALNGGDASLEFYAGYSTQWLTNATLKLYISTDGGVDWTKLWEAINDGNDWKWRKINLDLTSYSSNSNLKIAWQYVGKDGDIVSLDNIKLVGYPVTDINDKLVIPNEYSLSQNYPNPFNPSTVIDFALPTNSNVSIKVFNNLGEEVAELVNREMNAGYHSVNFNATNLSSGIYFYRISAGHFVKTNKMILLR